MGHGEQTSIVTMDVGGSHISAALFDLSSQTMGDVAHVLIPSVGAAADFIETFVALCREMAPEPAPVPGLAIAMPSPFDYERGISHMTHKFPQLYGVELKAALSRRLSLDAGGIHFLNDAAAYLIGELHQGGAIGVDRAVAITLGTGIGSAFAAGGRILTSGFGVPPGGEIWNLPYLGGIVEDFAGTAALQRLYFESTGIRAPVREIAAAAADDPAARAIFEQFGVGLGKLLRFTMAAFAPQRIVIGGGIARSASLFLGAAQRELADLAIELRVSELSDRAPLIGAAMSWQQRGASSQRPTSQGPRIAV